MKKRNVSGSIGCAMALGIDKPHVLAEASESKASAGR